MNTFLRRILLIPILATGWNGLSGAEFAGKDYHDPRTGFVSGVNIQGAFRSRIHPGCNEEEVIRRVAAVINHLGFSSVRIGGTSLFGGSFDPEHPGYGWSKYDSIEEVRLLHPGNPYIQEQWNFNRMAIKAAAKANVSVWIDLHRYIEESDIFMALDLAKSLGVKVLGITRDNEPYVPKRFPFLEDACRDFSAAKFDSFHWPVMYFSGDGPESRLQREMRTHDLVQRYRKPQEGIEIHCYCPVETKEDPAGWIRKILEHTMTTYKVPTSLIVAGEWSGKNQEYWENSDLERVITDYLSIFRELGIASYYQTLGSDNDRSGLWNFRTNSPNRGAETFVRLNQANSGTENAIAHP